MTGRILKGIGGFYTVLGSDGETHVLKARGKFRKQGVTPLPGDIVEFSSHAIDAVHARTNVLKRPAAANVDKLMVVISATVPRPDLMLADKLLVQCERLGISPVLIINKCDGCDLPQMEGIAAQYENTGYPIIRASACTRMGIEEIIAHIRGNTCCLAGQSAVGKSSILNAMAPGLHLQTGELSQKADRGKHTTRHAELLQVHGGTVIDTPGFSLLDLAQIEPNALTLLYPEMRRMKAECRFPECLHLSEPGCVIKSALENGDIAPERYERYVALMEELKEMRKHRYD